MHDSDDLDRKIDAALAGYGDPFAMDRPAEPALAERMLAGVRRSIAAESAPRRVRWLVWTWTLAAAVCVLVLVLFGLRPPHRQPNQARQTQRQGAKPQVAKAITEGTAEAGMPVVRKASRARSNIPAQAMAEKPDRLPKLDVFPTPQPLSGEGEALAFFVRRAPAHEVRELLLAQSHVDTPITIQELEIPPLQPLDEGGK
jgi:hypothetical protein